MAKLACSLSNEHWSSTTFLYTSDLTQLQLTFSAVLLLRIIRLTRTWFDQQFIDEAIGEVQASASLLSELKGKYYSDNVKAAITSFQTWLSSRTPSGANSALPVGVENDRQLQDDYFFDLNAMGGLEMGWESFLDQQSIGELQL
ncbi:hypothetical protein BCR39DRAFT_343189 [Naematelia encephala]|uniref:Uncharacterized protein n=1 Tax=Naematelia encephala TaxID=71784 RepID=A0A1Y2ANZ4_9TREE|nr:hypothetical protein BCR39DRAFT_343189 [Naematelia encephala]